MNTEYSQGPIGGPLPVAPVTRNGDSFFSADIPPIPGWIKFLLIPMFLLNIIVLGLAGFALGVVTDKLVESYSDAYFDSFGGLSFNVFASVWTILVISYIFLSLTIWRGSHYKWIVFILLILSIIWWLTAFAYLASDAKDALDFVKTVDSYLGYYGGGSNLSPYKRVLDWYNDFRTASKGMAGAAGIGAIIWILFIIFTTFYSMGLLRARRSGGIADARQIPMGTMEQKQVVQQAYPIVQYPPPIIQSPPPIIQSPPPIVQSPPPTVQSPPPIVQSPFPIAHSPPTAQFGAYNSQIPPTYDQRTGEGGYRAVSPVSTVGYTGNFQ